VTRRVWLIIALALIVGAGAAWWWHARPAPPVQWQGYADADFVKIGPTQSGLLTALHVQRGDRVTASEALFTQDDTEQRAARDQAAHLLAQAQRQLANLQAASRPTEIEQAQDNLAEARATLIRTTADLRRIQALVHTGATSRQSLDQARADNSTAQAHVDGSLAALAQARAPLGRAREIAAQQATTAAAAAELAQAEWRLSQRSVSAITGGLVADTLARPGETIAAGAAVISLLPPANIYVRFFVPETALSRLHLGDAVRLSCDGCAANLGATISYIAPQAEYTPPLIYSEASQEKLVFLIEARPSPRQAVLLNPGQPMLVRPQ